MAPPHLAPIVDAGEFLFLSGQIAFDASGKVGGDVARQTTICLERLEAALREAGLDRTSIVKCNIWLTRAEDFERFNDAYAAFFATSKPARSTVISGLAIAEAKVEIDAIARRPIA
jgi:2-iminobutanoate/2-iminopropanoate deaminase